MELTPLHFIAPVDFSIDARDYSDPDITGHDFLAGDKVHFYSFVPGTWSLWGSAWSGRPPTDRARGASQIGRALVVHNRIVAERIHKELLLVRDGSPVSKPVPLTRMQALAEELNFE